MNKTERKAYQKIESLIKTAKTAIEEAKEIARTHNLKFAVDFGNGICGEFNCDIDDDWTNSDAEEWQSSSFCAGG